LNLSIISQSNLDKENQSLDSILNSINKNQSIIFNSGAGAGKTYSLIESLKYVINICGKRLRDHNQKIICITYTNVATNEIKERLGNTDLVLISTIHERIWDLIKEYKKELVAIHKEKLQESVIGLERELEDKYEKYRELDSEQREIFTKKMLECRESFNQNYNVGAAEFRDKFQFELSNFQGMLRNIADFKKIVSNLYKINDYTVCLENIKAKKKEYNSVLYNPTYNKDRLHKMRISHETLLEYGLQIIESFDLLKQIIIDKYPYIFIDEYQDTNEKVIVIMNYLQKYANQISHNLFIGYFGDTAQNIYDSGVGKNITELHPNLLPIYKQFNRRSTKEIIEVINRIRKDEIKQVSIYDDCEGGSVKFYTGDRSDINSFIKKYELQWRITSKNKLHCFVLTNETVAKYSGFENIYISFRKTSKYKGSNYDQLNTELLSNDLMKLGEIQNLLFKIAQLKNNLDNNQSLVGNILPKGIYENMNIVDLRELIQLLKQSKGETLGEYIESISINYSKDCKGTYKKVINTIFDLEDVSIRLFKNHLLDKLFPNIKEDEHEGAEEIVQALLDIKLNEYDSWYKFILNKHEDKIIYHTYHGTKGLEFDNVIIIMENTFGKNRNYFNFFFEKYMQSDSLGDEDKYKFEQIQNLLYVSCSRAIRNLRVLYLDDIARFKNGVEEVFGETNHFIEHHDEVVLNKALSI